jgi:hypothetical protein
MSEYKFEVIGISRDNSETFITNYLLKEIHRLNKHGWVGNCINLKECKIDRLEMVKFLSKNEDEVGVKSSIEPEGYVSVKLRLIKNHIYIRTDNNDTPSDNLGQLPKIEK